MPSTNPGPLHIPFMPTSSLVATARGLHLLLGQLGTTRITQTDQHLLYLLMQSRQHIHAHRHAVDALALDRFRRSLAVLRYLHNCAEQRRLDEAEVQIGDSLRHAHMAVIRLMRQIGMVCRLQPHVECNGFVFGFTPFLR